MSLPDVHIVSATEANRSPGSVFSAAEKGARVLIRKNSTIQAVAIGMNDYAKLEQTDAGPQQVYTDLESMKAHLSPKEEHLGASLTMESVLMGGDAEMYTPGDLWNAHLPAVSLSPGYLPVDNNEPDGFSGVLTLSLTDVVRAGAGPVGLVIGAPGTGRSTVMRNIASSLAILNHPNDVQLILLDGSVSTTFGDLANLPHTILHTQDASEPGRTRVLGLLTEEVARRKELLELSGTSGVQEYNRMCRDRQIEADPLPHLVLLADCEDSSPILKQITEYITANSYRYGLHAVVSLPVTPGLATLPQLISLAETGFVISLRLNSENQSRSLLNVVDAAHLPVGRGDALVRFTAPSGETMRVRFTAYGPGDWGRVRASLTRALPDAPAQGRWNAPDPMTALRPLCEPVAAPMPFVRVPMARVEDLSRVVRGLEPQTYELVLGAENQSTNFLYNEDVRTTFPAVQSLVNTLGQTWGPSKLLVVWMTDDSKLSPWEPGTVPYNVIEVQHTMNPKEMAETLRDHLYLRGSGAGTSEGPFLLVISHEKSTRFSEVQVLQQGQSWSSLKRSRVAFISLLSEVRQSMSDTASQTLNFTPSAYRNVRYAGVREPGSFVVDGSPWAHVLLDNPGPVTEHQGPAAHEVIIRMIKSVAKND